MVFARGNFAPWLLRDGKQAISGSDRLLLDASDTPREEVSWNGGLLSPRHWA